MFASHARSVTCDALLSTLRGCDKSLSEASDERLQDTCFPWALASYFRVVVIWL